MTPYTDRVRSGHYEPKPTKKTLGKQVARASTNLKGAKRTSRTKKAK